MRDAETTKYNPGRIRRGCQGNGANSQGVAGEMVQICRKLPGNWYGFAVLPSVSLAGTAQSLSHASRASSLYTRELLEGVQPFAIAGESTESDKVPIERKAKGEQL